jgi:hypothetical protein
MKKGIGFGVGSGSGSISQRYGSVDPDPHQNITDPQHWFKKTLNKATPPSSPPAIPERKSLIGEFS